MSTEASRRRFLSMAGAMVAGTVAPAEAADQTAAEHLRVMTELPPDAPVVAMLVHPHMVALDLVGPLTIGWTTRPGRRPSGPVVASGWREAGDIPTTFSTLPAGPVERRPELRP